MLIFILFLFVLTLVCLFLDDILAFTLSPVGGRRSAVHLENPWGFCRFLSLPESAVRPSVRPSASTKRTLFLDFKSLIVQKGLCFLILSSLIFSLLALSLSLSLVDPKSTQSRPKVNKGSQFWAKARVGFGGKRVSVVEVGGNLKYEKDYFCLFVYSFCQF